jgi:hypothetical protein
MFAAELVALVGPTWPVVPWIFIVFVAVLILMPLIDGLFWLRDRYRDWRAGTSEPLAAAPGDTLHVTEPRSELRRRSYLRLEPNNRSFHEGRPNEPTD